MKFSILFGGKAGQGANILSDILGKSLIQNGYYVFVSRDYQSLIRGGHNFNVLTFSDKEVRSNESKIDLIVAIDNETLKIHKNDLKRGGNVIMGEGRGNMYFAGRLFKILCMDFKILENALKELGRFEENMKEAKEGYEEENKTACSVIFRENNLQLMNGNQGVADGAIRSGIDIYYFYPMTPATNVAGELAEKQEEKHHLVLELENEIAVMNAAIGSSATGAKTMVGTSGGGFDLMTEALSFAGIAETPVVIYLASRPGPSTGLATYTGQGDLNLARHSGHGEFPRLVVAPGDALECQELTNQAFFFSQKYLISAFVLSDKHLAESLYTVSESPEIVKSKKSVSLKKFNSYEADNFGFMTENPSIVNKNVRARLKKQRELEKEAEKFNMFKVFGKKDSNNIVISWGSTKGAVLDAIEGLDAKFIQALYLEPFSSRLKRELEGKNIILVENNATGQLAGLIAEKTGIFIPEKNKILRYDGRPFLADELNAEISRRLG